MPRLRHWRDWQSLFYLAALPVLAAWQWVHGFSLWLYAPMLFLTLGVGVIHHNHVHLRMWRGRRMNRLTDFWITLLQGHPTFVFWPAHVANHHRHRHGPKDVARTYRFGGDTNHLRGYLLHPFQAVWVLFPLFMAWLGRLYRHRRGAWRYCMAQYALWLASWAALFALDWRKALVFVILPQLHGLHWLLATNYLLAFGDFSNYVIVDRIGLSIELVPHLLHTSNNLPSGKRGILAWFRTGADSVNDSAFRLLNVATTA